MEESTRAWDQQLLVVARVVQDWALQPFVVPLGFLRPSPSDPLLVTQLLLSYELVLGASLVDSRGSFHRNFQTEIVSG